MTIMNEACIEVDSGESRKVCECGLELTILKSVFDRPDVINLSIVKLEGKYLDARKESGITEQGGGG